jgi:hypothetical protein
VVPLASASVASALIKIISDSSVRSRMSIEAQRVGAELAAIDQPVAQLEQVYHEVIAEAEASM